MEIILIDTCVLVDFLRGKEKAVSYLESLESPPYISSLTIAELYAGVRDNERPFLERLISCCEVVALNAEIAKEGGLYKRDYFKSHGVGLVDALLAASVNLIGGCLATLNVKHFPMLSQEKVIAPYKGITQIRG